jgi:uncharacterized protein YecE (DUF72 family)
MEKLHVGTCSWSDRSLLESGWYPRFVSNSENRLRFYSERFSTVEVDSTFYALPHESSVYRWVVQTPPGFIFNIKAYGLFTYHKVSYNSLPQWIRNELPQPVHGQQIQHQNVPFSLRRALWKQFVTLVTPLHQMGRLGYILFQLPPWFKYSRPALKYFERLAEIAPPFKVAIEVRHRSWFNKGRNDLEILLRDSNMAYVIVDEPQLSWTVPAERLITATWGSVIRFHGRNAEMWQKKGASVQERFRYLYTNEELAEWKGYIENISQDVAVTFIMFNNCYKDYAVQNALEMQRVLGLRSFVPTAVQKKLDFSDEDK